ncbi:MAG TPA: glucose-1-phosphate adenylyltransferase [Planctomycetota bacterium]|nr:glucose-1-phosphate adenylyltransferase [Planctomycetota bacterium]
MTRVLGFVMAGGKGERLFPLTRDRSKPAVPFGGKYRIVDFVLSSFVNSGIRSIYVLVQYKSQSLIEHLRVAWPSTGLTPEHFITLVPPQQRFVGEALYRGTADAVSQNLNLVRDLNPDLIAIFGADHIYRMDLRRMVDLHLEKGAEATIACIPVPITTASAFGVAQTEPDGRISAWVEKSSRPPSLPGDPTRAYASMGNYVFDRKALEQVLFEDCRRSTDHDFGRTIVPEMIPRGRVYAFDFLGAPVEGTAPHEEPGYWRDVGTLESYWSAHMDLLGDTPKFDLSNRRWPIRTDAADLPPAHFRGCTLEDVLIAEGSSIVGARVVRSVVGRGCTIEPGCEIEDSIVMDHTSFRAGARAKRAIVDRHNEIAAGATLGFDAVADRRRGYHVDPKSGLVVVQRGVTRVE